MTRAEHLDWCKQRALEYVDAGDVSQGFASMMSDLRKHAELESHPGIHIGAGMMMLPGWIDNAREVRHWIEGFN